MKALLNKPDFEKVLHELVKPEKRLSAVISQIEWDVSNATELLRAAHWYKTYRELLDPAKLDAAIQLSQRLFDVLDELKNDLEKPKNN